MSVFGVILVHIFPHSEFKYWKKQTRITANTDTVHTVYTIYVQYIYLNGGVRENVKCQHTLFGIRTLNMNKDGIFKASIQIQMELGVKIFKLKLLKMHGLTNVSITT